MGGRAIGRGLIHTLIIPSYTKLHYAITKVMLETFNQTEEHILLHGQQVSNCLFYTLFSSLKAFILQSKLIRQLALYVLSPGLAPLGISIDLHSASH